MRGQPRHTARIGAASGVRGVTLLELLVVVSIIAMAAAGVASGTPHARTKARIRPRGLVVGLRVMDGASVVMGFMG
jgi:prepilin-type N-terminal cleavage/methylation domain-containing protein